MDAMENTNSFDLTQEAILVRLTFSQTHLSASSKRAAREIAEANDAEADSVKAGVTILRRQDRAEILKAVDVAYNAFHANTLPWDDRGYRLCPMKAYPRLAAELASSQTDFEVGVQSLLGRYDELAQSYAYRVGSLADEIPFPSREALVEGFAFTVAIMPLANPADVRLRHVSAEVAEQVRNDATMAITAKLADAQSDVVLRLKKLVANVKDRCSKDDSRIYDSLIENIAEAVNVLPALNVTSDPEVDRLIARVRKELSAVDVKSLRKDDSYRAATSQAASAVLADLAGYKAPVRAARLAPKPAPVTPAPEPPAIAEPAAEPAKESANSTLLDDLRAYTETA